MGLRKFAWIGKNRTWNDYTVSSPMTTDDLLSGNWPTFFSLSNREKFGNCDFIMEVFEGDTITMVTQNAMFELIVTMDENVTMGHGGFNTLPLADFFNAQDFESAEIGPPNP